VTPPAAPVEARIDLYADALVPTDYGPVRTVVFRERGGHEGCEPREHIALIVGTIAEQHDVLARIHSECWTGEVMHSLKCDCREQLDIALKRIAAAGTGVVLYLRQEGRGIGLGNKIRAYALQEQGMDTVEANRSLGFRDDQRAYDVAAAMLRALGVKSVALLTNNPAKVAGLQADGVDVVRRVPMAVTANEYNASYLATKNARMGHDIPALEIEQGEEVAVGKGSE
jgi:GTP cyclohydrolase II/3,4-dihydroxy 2-butanone 4-phosphate synthase/GTP cyclohydrolase II